MSDKILKFVFAILPKKKIGAFILGAVSTAAAMVMGASNDEIKIEFCKDVVKSESANQSK